MTAPRHAIARRVRARRRERGAVLLVVAMTLAMLATLGVYALQQSVSEVKTSGYARQAAQTHYITELGSVAMLDTFSPANASYFDAQMLLPPSEQTRCDSALATNAPQSTPIARRCAKVPQAYFQTAWRGGANTDALKADSLAPLGKTAFHARFTNELTEPITGGFQPGFDVHNGKCFRRYTITTYGQLTTLDQTRILSREVSRARVTTGPFDCGN